MACGRLAVCSVDCQVAPTGNEAMSYEIMALDHVQLAMPAGGEAAAEAFYAGVLGFTRQPKPEPMASRGGCWFIRGSVAVHLGVEQDFRPARKAHPALVVRNLPALEAALRAAGSEVRPNPDQPTGAGSYVDDPFGNRIEFIAG
jgi:catechol 2,3-dioxygenase-like lactoylglutathione lyase family enzyme